MALAILITETNIRNFYRHRIIGQQPLVYHHQRTLLTNQGNLKFKKSIAVENVDTKFRLTKNQTTFQYSALTMTISCATIRISR